MTDPDLVGNTQDLHVTDREHPAEKDLPADVREAHTQHIGERNYTWGLILMIGGFILALGCAVASDNRLFSKPNSSLFGFLGLIALEAIGAVLVQAGAHERRNRPVRAMNRLILVRIDTILAKAETTDRRVDFILDLVSPVSDRLDALEKRMAAVPDYTQGLADGARIIGGVARE